jgi:hypothetical protein
MLPSGARGGSGGIATAFVCVHARWGSAGHLVLSTGRSRLSRLSLLTETRRNQSVSEYMTRWLEDFAKGHLAPHLLQCIYSWRRWDCEYPVQK